MKKKVIKSKSRRFSFGGKSLEIIDWGYNDFKYIEPITTPRYLNHYSLHFVVKGSGTFNYGKNTYQLGEKSVFCLKPNVLISYYPNKNDPWRYFWINFRGEESEEILEGSKNSKYCYDNGVGVDQNYEEAVRWCELAAEQGDAEAQNNLGVCYYNGHGVEQDYSKAFDLWQKSAQHAKTT